MSKLKDIDAKPKKPTDTLMTAMHSNKQQGLPKWTKCIKNKNPDLLLLEDRLVVRLDYIDNQKQAESCQVDGTIYSAKDGHYYGKVVSKRLTRPHLQAQIQQVVGGGQNPNAGEMPPESDDEE